MNVNGNLTVSNQLTVKDGLTLNGTATIADGFSGLYFVGSQTLGGNATVVFGNSAYVTGYPSYIVGYNYLYTDAATSTLTIGPAVTISGNFGVLGGYYSSGYVASGGPIINLGTIQADTSGGTITLLGSGWQNPGTLLATNGGILSLQGTGANTGSASIAAGGMLSVSGSVTNTGNTISVDGSGSTVSLGGTIIGGTVAETNGAVLSVYRGTLDGVTVNGSLSIGNQLTVKDGLTLNGTATIADGFSGLYFVGSQTLGGNATVVFGNSAYVTGYPSYIVGYNYLYTDAATSTLTIGPAVTISGNFGVLGGYYSSGYVASGGPIINLGTIQADTSGGTITVNGVGGQIAGNLEALNGATLSVSGTLANTGTVSVDGTSALAFGGTMIGGTITTQTGAQITSGTLDGVTVNGNWQVIDDNSLTVQGGLTLNGTLTLGNTNTIGYLNFSVTQTLGGTGAVAFGSAAESEYHYTNYNGLFVTTSGTTLTIGPNVTVSGGLGYIAYASNQGSSGGTVVNQGTITWANGGNIYVPGTLTNNGTLTVDGTSSMSFGVIVGGTITTQTGAQITSGTLDGVTINGSWQLVGDNSVTVQGGLTLNGTLTLGNASTIGYLNFSGTQTLGGTATVVFGSTNNGNYYNGLFVTTTGTTLTIGPNVTVSGALGYIGYVVYQGNSSGNVDNQGTIQANVSGGMIGVNGTGDQIAGNLEALNGATLSVSGTLANTGTVSVDGTSALAFGGTMIGGTITTQTGAQITSGTLDGVTINGSWQLVGDNSVTVQGGLTLNGTLTLGNASTIGYLNFSGTQTLGGTATVVFGSTNNGNYYNGLFVTTTGTTLTIGPNVTVSGALGYIGYVVYQGNSSGNVDNQGTIQANVSGGMIGVNGTGDQIAGNLEALNGATLSVSGTLANTGTVSVDGTSALAFGGTMIGGTITTQTGAQITGGTLDGVTVNGNWQVTGDKAVTVQDGLTLNGTLMLGNTNSIGYLTFSGTGTLGGTGNVVFGSTTYSYSYYTNYNGLFVTPSGTTLTIGPNVTVTGAVGYIGYAYVGNGSYQGNSGGNVDNQGTIQANVNGGTVTVNGAGDQIAGSLEALNGATLSVSGTLANTGTVSVDGTSELALSGTMIGGTITTQTGAQITGGTLDGVTVNGNWQVTGDKAVTVQDGLTLNGTLMLGNTNSIGYLTFSGTGTLGGTGNVVFGSTTYSYSYYTNYNGLFVTPSGTTLTIGPNVTVTGAVGYIGYAYVGNGSYQGNSGGNVDNQGTIQANVSGGTIVVNSANNQNTGNLEVFNGATLSVQGAMSSAGTLLAAGGGTLDIDGTLTNTGLINADSGTIAIAGGVSMNASAQLNTAVGSSLSLTGNLLGNTTNAAGFTPSGTTLLDGSGSANSPQLLEVMSEDLGDVAAGFTNNFAYGNLILGSGNYVELVDNAHNSPGIGPEALYVNSLLVPSGTTFNLNGFDVYARFSEINGNLVGGTINSVNNAVNANHFAIIGTPSSITAGGSATFTVVAENAAGTAATGYLGTVGFSSSDAQAVLPASATLFNGIGTFTATLKTAGAQTLTATDTGNSALTGTSSAIVVNPAAGARFTAAGIPASIMAGIAFDFTLQALDQFGNATSNYPGTVQFSSTDSAASLPALATLTAGVGIFSAILRTGGNQTLSANDTAAIGIGFTSGSISVVPAQVSVALDPASDTGAPNDPGLTNITDPVFDVQVNEAGTIKIDFTGNGTVTATRGGGTGHLSIQRPGPGHGHLLRDCQLPVNHGWNRAGLDHIYDRHHRALCHFHESRRARWNRRRSGHDHL